MLSSLVWKPFICQLLSYWYTFWMLDVHILDIPIVHIILHCISYPIFLNNNFNHLFNFISWPIYIIYFITHLFIILLVPHNCFFKYCTVFIYCILCIHMDYFFEINILLKQTLYGSPIYVIIWEEMLFLQSYPLCPYCYNNPPFGDMRKGMGCNECTHPTCVHAMTQNSVSSCVECENGTLILDQASAPKWRMACNK